jgi:lysophospholipase L1-like esterase
LPASGTTFPVGTTTVTCTATDAQQRVSSCSLTVAVATPPRLRATKFVAFGDSITAGQDGQNSVTSLTPGVLTFVRSIFLLGFEYPTVLRASLQARYSLQIDSITVINQGNSGEAAGDAATFSRFTSAISGSQAVLLMEGSNDLYNGYRDSAVVDAGFAGIQRMVRAAKTAGLVPFLATVPPMNAVACTPLCRGFAAPLVPGFDDRIRALAQSENVPLVDVYKAFNGDMTLLSQDGLHPNASGYARIADTFFQSIKGTLEQPTTLTGAPASGQTIEPFSGY